MRNCKSGRRPWRIANLFVTLLVFMNMGQMLVNAQPNYQIEVYGGLSFTEETSLHIQQKGHPDTTLDPVKYSSREFESPPYYGIRAARLWGLSGTSYFKTIGAEIEFIHDKIVLENADHPQDVVQKFHVTDGINFLVLNAVATAEINPRWDMTVRAGPTIVISHPETIVRGLKKGSHGDPTGYEYSGLGIHFAMNANRPITERSRLLVEYKFTGARPVMSIAEGSAMSPIRTHHIIVGWSWSM